MNEGAVVPPFHIRPVRTQVELRAVRDLFAAYAVSLPVDLDYQDFGSEVADLPGKYAPPKGDLWVAWDGVERPIACIGLRPVKGGNACEMKRLYVVPEARSFGLGSALTRAVIERARERGYSALLLDTLPTMVSAAIIYERMGFRHIDAYYGPTPPGTVFMELDLTN